MFALIFLYCRATPRLERIKIVALKSGRIAIADRAVEVDFVYTPELQIELK